MLTIKTISHSVTITVYTAKSLIFIIFLVRDHEVGGSSPEGSTVVAGSEAITSMVAKSHVSVPCCVCSLCGSWMWASLRLELAALIAAQERDVELLVREAHLLHGWHLVGDGPVAAFGFWLLFASAVP